MTLKHDLEQAWNTAAPADKKAAPAAVLRQKRDQILANLAQTLNSPSISGLEAMFSMPTNWIKCCRKQ